MMRRIPIALAAVAVAVVTVAAPGFARDDQTTAVAGHTSREQPPATLTTVSDSGIAIVPAGAQRASASRAAFSAASDGGYACVKKTKPGTGLAALAVQHLDYSSGSWEMHYIVQMYSMAKARYVANAWTTQFEQCVIGGSRNKHFYERMAHTEAEVSITDATNRLIGYHWGTAVSSGDVKATLNFNVGVSKATSISGSLPVTTGGKEAGSIGSGLCGKFSGSSGNQVNSAWNYTYPGYGTNDFKGNVGHALYEFPQANKTWFPWTIKSCTQARY